jgi:hypothetical protein
MTITLDEVRPDVTETYDFDDAPAFVEKTIDEKPPSKAIPFFEGQIVDFTKASFTSGTNLEIDDAVFRVDEVVQFVVEARCAGIAHKVNEKSGAMERVHTMKVIDVLPIPFETTLEQLREKAG